ncbi:MAG: DUF1080 domain-containing protein [Ferruginibacter sp.]|nr:DUF1080 domain-containing protein [Bacteroidota bacterium]MBX2918970.1 DUF1080 domain-containing protein [Ferruginibacter sp.]MCB0709998.1 DUF1080 domain-containing protein [Chitinophagaceae bacterium]MCC7379296.1 DUF1080 domain-containing protein [Chitinophagaceae bacterium]
MKNIKLLLLFTIVVSGCNTQSKKAMSSSNEWISLFDGKTLKGWHTYGKKTIGEAWKVKDGVLYLDTEKQDGWQTKAGGDIVTDEEFENFDLQLEWKISKNGNSGIIFYVHEDTSKYEYCWNTGPEMQVLDNDGHPDGKIIKHRAGDLYDLISCSKETVKPVGEWNQVEIIANNGKLDFFLNGTNVVSTTLWNDDWKNLIAGSKFKNYPGFGTYKKGRIALQDHGNTVWYRNIKIKRL